MVVVMMQFFTECVRFETVKLELFFLCNFFGKSIRIGRMVVMGRFKVMRVVVMVMIMLCRAVRMKVLMVMIMLCFSEMLMVMIMRVFFPKMLMVVMIKWAGRRSQAQAEKKRHKEEAGWWVPFGGRHGHGRSFVQVSRSAHNTSQCIKPCSFHHGLL